MRTGCHYLICLSVPGMCVRVCNIRRFYSLRELYEADFHKLGIYGSGPVWANAWDVFRRVSSRGGRGRRAAVHFVVRFGCGGIFSGFFFRLFSSSAHGLLQVRGHLASFISVLVIIRLFIEPPRTIYFDCFQVPPTFSPATAAVYTTLFLVSNPV